MPNESCHPHEYKTSSINCLLNTGTYPISNETKRKEINIIKSQLHNNKYNVNTIKHPTPEKQKLNTDNMNTIKETMPHMWGTQQHSG
jgi:hypothetical protein